MGIWIRSQDREHIVNADDIYYSSEYVETGNYILYQRGSYTYLLGEYSTKEKALRVIDLIHERIETINHEVYMAAQASPFGRFLIQDYKVFQMPQDDEVCEMSK